MIATDPRTERIVTLLGDLIVPTTTRCYPTLASSRCIMASRIGLNVLTHFDVPAEALAVQCFVANQAWVDWYQALPPCDASVPDGERAISNPMPPLAWSMAVGYGGGSPGGYDGHVILSVGAHLLDLDFRQFDRPAHNIRAPAAARYRRRPEFDAGAQCAYRNDNILVVLTKLDDTTWQQAPDWRGSHPEATAALIAAIAETLTKEAACVSKAQRPATPGGSCTS